MDQALLSLPAFPAVNNLPRPLRQNAAGVFVYADGAWEKAGRPCGSMEPRGLKRQWPGRSEVDRHDFCRNRNLDLCKLSRPADVYLQRVHRLRCFAADAGGGGDCLFLAVAAGLETLRERLADVALPVQALVADGASRTVIAARLRNMVGDAVLNWSSKRFLDFVTICLSEEVAGTWLDAWKMSALIAGSPFAFLKRVNSVDSVSHGRTNDVTLQCKHGDSARAVRHSIPGGKRALLDLRKAVAARVSQPGHTHWGTHWDIDILARELKIGFCIVGNQPVDSSEDGVLPASVLHSYAAIEDVESYICLYNISNQHFQLMVLDLESGLQSVFLPGEMPTSLAEELHKRSAGC